MKVAYFDCFSGIAGDMILGALLDVGVPLNFLKDEIQKLRFSGYRVEMKKVEKKGITASDVTITCDEEQPHRSFEDITHLIDDSALDTDIKDRSIEIFLNLAQAESKVHNIEVKKVHFHEVGSVDSIIDIVGSVIGLKKLKIHEIFCSPLPLGSGFVVCQHGTIPVPAPATVELLKGIPTYALDSGHEMVTPTGAAIITSLCSQYGDMPPMDIEHVGYGAGKIKSAYPGVLKVVVGKKREK
jgi:uncharacterized protein (TIGR00299 family) protein